MGLTREVSQPQVTFVGGFNSGSTQIQFYTTAHSIGNATTYYGYVIDRRELGANYNVVDLALSMYSTVGSTEGAVTKGFSIVQYLQHGDSSGAGDMAAFSSCQYGAKNYFTTLDTSDMNKYTTGQLQGFPSPVQTWDISSAKRYLRHGFAITRTAGVSTCTDKIEGAYVSAVAVFKSQDNFPQNVLKYFSTSTSTST